MTTGTTHQVRPEKVLWEGRPRVGLFFPHLAVLYRVTTQRILVITGFIAKQTEEVELIKVTDYEVSQGLVERLIGFGDITLSVIEQKTPTITLDNVPDPDAVRNLIRQAALDRDEELDVRTQREH